MHIAIFQFQKKRKEKKKNPLMYIGLPYWDVLGI